MQICCRGILQKTALETILLGAWQLGESQVNYKCSLKLDNYYMNDFSFYWKVMSEGTASKQKQPDPSPRHSKWKCVVTQRWLLKGQDSECCCIRRTQIATTFNIGQSILSEMYDAPVPLRGQYIRTYRQNHRVHCRSSSQWRLQRSGVMHS